ncbi:MAG: hypothetical protein AMXMBFR78_19560 [Rubrivivax sp.]|jgi:hypothetical protein|nr:MAG: hypothetical protein HKUEN07_06240 [Rhodocyclaceae bacterium]
MSTSDDNVKAAALACLAETVAQLIEEGSAKAGTEDGLFAYAVLNRLKNNASALGVPLDAIGLDGFKVDSLLSPARQAA